MSDPQGTVRRHDGRLCIWRNCAFCQNKFMAMLKDVRRGKGRYCSYRCRTKAQMRERWGEPTAENRLWPKAKRNTETNCLEWQGELNSKGYGKAYGKACRDGKWILAHRWAYIETHGEIPDGMIVRHTCDNPKCIEPEHLLLGTRKDNSADAKARGRLVLPHELGRGRWQQDYGQTLLFSLRKSDNQQPHRKT